MTLLAMVNAVAAEVGLDATGVALTGEPAYKQIAALLLNEGEELSRFHDWRSLKTTMTLQGDGETTLFDLPADMDRLMPGMVLWEYGRPYIPLMQVSDQQFLVLRSAVSSPIRPVWRLVSNKVEFWRAPQLGVVINGEYRRANWIVGSDGETKATWQSDSDTTLLPERLLKLGAIWRFKAAKGFDYAEPFRTAQVERAKAVNADHGMPTIRQSESTGGTEIRLKNSYSVIV
jgi:hypothetical protein